MSLFDSDPFLTSGESTERLKKRFVEFLIDNFFKDPDGYSIYADGNQVKAGDSDQKLFQ